jgi:phage tail-like protein
MAADTDPAVSVCFVVKLDDIELGAFTTCEGLGAEIVIEQREEGGNNSFVWQLPSRIKYPNIKLTRPLTKDTEQVAKWIAKTVGRGTATLARTGSIHAMRADGTVVARWNLLSVLPVRWTGPSLNAESAKVATETIEIAHHGFTS